MQHFISLLEILIWPLFILLMLALFRRPAGRLYNIILGRIEEGSEFSVNVGQGGLTIGQAPKLAPPDDGGESVKGVLHPEAEGVEEDQTEAAAAGLHLVHAAMLDKPLSRQRGEPTYRVKAWLESDRPNRMLTISQVSYHMHPELSHPQRMMQNRDQRFELDFETWGEFTLKADVEIEGVDGGVLLERYINL